MVGAGGHGKAVVGTVHALGLEVAGVLDDDPVALGRRLLGVEVLGGPAELDRHEGATAVVAVGANAARKRIVEAHAQVGWRTLVHPSAYVDPSAEIGAGTVILAGATVQVEARIGAHCIVNTGAVIEHECQLDAYVQVASGATVAGAARLREGAFVAVGATVVPAVELGAWCTLAAGAVAVRDVPGHVTAKGVPARFDGGVRRNDRPPNP